MHRSIPRCRSSEEVALQQVVTALRFQKAGGNLSLRACPLFAEPVDQVSVISRELDGNMPEGDFKVDEVEFEPEGLSPQGAAFRAGGAGMRPVPRKPAKA